MGEGVLSTISRTMLHIAAQLKCFCTVQKAVVNETVFLCVVTFDL